MKTRRTTLVAVLSQTFTTTSTSTTTSRAYSASEAADNGFSQVVTPVGNGPRWCSQCETPIVLMSPEHAATVCFQTTRAIYRLVEAGRVHFIDGPEGVFVCPASLISDWYGERGAPLLPAVARMAVCEIKGT